MARSRKPKPRLKRFLTLYVVYEDDKNPRATAALERLAGPAGDRFSDVVSGELRLEWPVDKPAKAEQLLLQLLGWCKRQLKGEWAVWLNSAPLIQE